MKSNGKLKFVLALVISFICVGCNKNDPGFVDRTDKFIVINKTSINGIGLEFKSCGSKVSTADIDAGGTVNFSCTDDSYYDATLTAIKAGEYNQTWTGEFVADVRAGTFTLELQNSGIVFLSN